MKYHTYLSRILLSLGVLASTLWTAPPVHAQPETLTIAAANSLKDAFRKVLPLFEAQHPEINVRVIYGPSQTLRKQIEEGAPVDVFLPSLFEEIHQLEKKGLVIQGSKRVYAGTSLVLITGTTLPAPIGSIQDLHTVPIRRIAIGDPKTSSVGKVALQFIKYSKLEPQLKAKHVYGEHSRAVLDLVAKGEAEVGIVYRTDAASDEHIRILDTAPADSHTPIRYGVAIVWTAKNLSGSGDFIEFLLTPQTQDQLKEHGFDQASQDTGVTQQQEVKP
ncbi:molybdate ABC transporter substrate-binding protein [Nitrospira sp. NS4]|uniref:molybdate ABC transporter substrate-binding protein n=1 Tax=Nitrospira sp. NS4 TaxID=3414498 RepID=UPI003C30AD1D